MKLLLTATSWFSVVLGMFAIIYSEGDKYAIIGGMLFFIQGTLAIVYMDRQNKEVF